MQIAASLTVKNVLAKLAKTKTELSAKVD